MNDAASPAPNSDQVYKIVDSVVFRETQGDLVLAFDRATGVMYEFNDTGSDILKAFNGQLSLEAIASKLAAEYDASPDDILPDVTDMAQSLLSSSLLVEIPQEG